MSLSLVMLTVFTPASVLSLSKLSSSSFLLLFNVLSLVTLGEDFTGQRGVRNLKDLVEEEVADPLLDEIV